MTVSLLPMEIALVALSSRSGCPRPSVGDSFTRTVLVRRTLSKRVSLIMTHLWHRACQYLAFGSLGPCWSSEGDDSRFKIINRHEAIRWPFDEEKLRLAREFLQREFRSSICRDYFDFDRKGQVFTIEGSRVRQTLLIPAATFEHPDFSLLLSGHLVTVLNSAEGIPVTLTPQGPTY